MTEEEQEHEELHDRVEREAFLHMYHRFNGDAVCVAEALSNLLAGYLSDPNTDREHADWIMQSLHMSRTLIGNPVGNA